ncbi:uncharacterized protein LOC128990554 [Macrosteles quadrilineatus]|nr:uncharacterized protein LOC128990554 [Macrosteles quadrilineatus]
MKINEEGKSESLSTGEGLSLSEDARRTSDTSWNRGKKSSKQPAARSRFRKGGIVATATIHSYVEAESDDMDGSSLDKKKKKKKRKLMGINRRVRKVIATVVATSQKPENEQSSLNTKR